MFINDNFPMNLPNYFLADLPPEAILSPLMITDACQALKRNRARYLAQRTTEQQVKLLSNLADEWLDSASPFRQLALDQGPAQTGFAKATIERGLDGFFRQLTRENLHALLVQDLGDIRRLDELVVAERGSITSTAALAVAPEFLVHITAGNLPNPTLMSMVLGVLMRSAQFVKCASGAAFLPRLFAHSLYEADAKLGACLEIADWRGGDADSEPPPFAEPVHHLLQRRLQWGNAELENILFAETDCVTVTGSDETLAAIRSRVPPKARFLGYGHRLSFGFVTGEALPSSIRAKQVAARAADDVVAWNQLGCLSPHVIYVQSTGVISAEGFAELLAEELARRETTEPRGELPTEVAAAIATRRGFYEVRSAHNPGGTRHWCSPDSTAWTVIYEVDPLFQVSCLNRFVYVKSVPDLPALLQNADSVHSRVSTVGVAMTGDEAPDIARQLARWGALRVCPLGQMQNPPLTWRHDGRPALGDLVTWTDYEH
jgi:hypothetical protein